MITEIAHCKVHCIFTSTFMKTTWPIIHHVIQSKFFYINLWAFKFYSLLELLLKNGKTEITGKLETV